jgi:hypothetical protein
VYSTPAVKAILHVTARQPFLLQVLCSVLVDELNARRWRDGDPMLTAKDVHVARQDAVARAEDYFLDMWRNSVPDAARELVRQMARSNRARANIDHTNDDLTEAVLALQRRHIVAHTTRGLALTVPLFALYVRSSQSVET